MSSVVARILPLSAISIVLFLAFGIGAIAAMTVVTTGVATAAFAVNRPTGRTLDRT